MSLNRSQPYDNEDSYTYSQSFHPYHGEMPIPVCPKCHSVHVETRNRARKLGGAIGAVAGATSVTLAAAAKARTAAVLVSSPFAITFGSIAAAIIPALISGASSVTTGVKLGEVIDEKILNNYLCHSCGHTFSLKQS
ncbi:hypothetical protein [Noviherbaspirillum soli]|uniref:hypothetical protein n=1 Tax=Noviherbaspirillum soli TaxID=1064518 RepID=UPI00188A6F72|nr:hypothetical protein [Noviherbaspirillum soli]